MKRVYVVGTADTKGQELRYVKLLIDHPQLGFSYKVYFGDIYQIDRRLMPELDYATLFHLGEYRTAENDKYGAMTDDEATLVLADKLRPGGELHFYSGSFAYDRAEASARALAKVRAFADAGSYKSLRIWRKTG